MFNKHDNKISKKTNIYTTAKPIPAFKQKFSMGNLMPNKGKIQAKLGKTMVILKKQSNLLLLKG
jgi:hypothetical protein